jgi:hypothetical protein
VQQIDELESCHEAIICWDFFAFCRGFGSFWPCLDQRGIFSGVSLGREDSGLASDVCRESESGGGSEMSVDLVGMLIGADHHILLRRKKFR